MNFDEKAAELFDNLFGWEPEKTGNDAYVVAQIRTALEDAAIAGAQCLDEGAGDREYFRLLVNS